MFILGGGKRVSAGVIEKPAEGEGRDESLLATSTARGWGNSQLMSSALRVGAAGRLAESSPRDLLVVLLVIELERND
jgi:hypothetical protein